MADTSGRALDLASLRAAYAAGTAPAAIIGDCCARIAHDQSTAVWISRVQLERALERVVDIERRRAGGETLPLFGIPFAVKDNIDVAGMPTTAACPAFAYTPAKSATVVTRLEAAGAILLGKTNLDQFATGLTGTRSPYGIPACVFDRDYIAGGSSSGSAVTVANGAVASSLGTDTAGSGRVPAAFNNIVGLKPTRGWLSTSGVVPACRSLDCVSVFAGSVGDAIAVAETAAGFDAEDAFSRTTPVAPQWPFSSLSFRFGVPQEALDFLGDTEAASLYAASIERLEALGGVPVPFDFAPFREAGQLLYGGPWVAERLASLEAFASRHADDMLPVTREIIHGASRLRAVDAYRGLYDLAALARRSESAWPRMDLMLLPTTATTYRIAEVLADPIRLNNQLGLYTNFANLLDLSAIAVPAGFRSNGLPVGVTLFARAFQDRALAAVASRLHHALPAATIGATRRPLPALAPTALEPSEPARFEIAVVGAHLAGEPLNRELTEAGARLERTVQTAPGYSLYALTPQKPGLVFDGIGAGAIETEIWSLPAAAFAAFVASVPAPLAIGTVRLADGSAVKGFLCEAHAVRDRRDITGFGGWRAYRR